MKKIFLMILAATVCLSMCSCVIKIDLKDLIPAIGAEPEENAVDSVIIEDHQFSGEETMIVFGDGDGGMVGIVVPDETEPSNETQAEAPTISYSEDVLIGRWTTATRYGDSITIKTFEFFSDGTYTLSDAEYGYADNNPGLFGEGQHGWCPLPMGFPQAYGTYILSGDTITLTCLGDTIEEYPEPYVSSIRICSMAADSCVFESTNVGEENKYVKNVPYMDLDSDEYVRYICGYLGIDVNP